MSAPNTIPSMSLGRLLGSWITMCLLMIANGVAREAVFVGAMGRIAADLASAALGAGIILLASRLLFTPLAGQTTRQLLRVSAWFVGLTVAFEFSFGHYVDGKSWEELFANYAIWNGRLWPLLLILLALTPFIWGRWAHLTPPSHPPGVPHAR